MSERFLMILSVLGQLLSVFPFVVLCESAGFGGFTWWHYPVLYVVFAVFYICGRACALWALDGNHSRSFRPKAFFLSRAAFCVPTAVYIIVCAVFELSTCLYMYALPAALIMYYAGYTSAKKNYSDVFTRGWFALYFVSALIFTLLMYFIKDEEITRVAGVQMCVGLGVMIVLAAILTNQTNIDLCTRQRDSGRVALPRGLRRYNCLLSAAISVAAVALLLLAAPLAELLSSGLLALLKLILSLFQNIEYDEAEDEILSTPDGGGQFWGGTGTSALAVILQTLLYVGIFVVIIAFRKQIAAFFRELIAPLFKVREEQPSLAYTDEFSELPELTRSGSHRKREQQLYKLYRKEHDPVLRYRLGYRFILTRLCLTQYPPVPADFTDIHRIKCERGFHSEDIGKIFDVYNDVRYGGRTPTNEELGFEESFIEEIRR